MPKHVSWLLRMSEVCVCLLIGLLPAPAARAQGNGTVLIAPTRIVFEGARHSAEVSMINVGAEPVAYTISLIHERMTEDGKLEVIDTPDAGERFADDLVRISPRQVILKPSVAEHIRIDLRLPAGLSAGEYRSHLIFRNLADISDGAEPVGGAVSHPGSHGRLTIPVIVRYGSTSATVAMSGLAIQNGPQAMTISGVLTRTGNASVYGDLDVQFTEAGGAPRSVGLLNGVAVYTPNSERKFTVTLSLPPGTQIPHGEFKVQYKRPQDGGEGLLAESTLVTP